VLESKVRCWKHVDLLRCIGDSLILATRLIQSISEYTTAQPAVPDADDFRLVMRSKVVAETAMLLLCVDSIVHQDIHLQTLASELKQNLIPLARHNDVLAEICLDPGQVYATATAHLILNRLGCPDPDVDELIRGALVLGTDFGPERLPYQNLQATWLERLWPAVARRRHRSSHLVNSLLGRPVDVLAASRLDIYAFTHAVIYATGFGEWPLVRVRSRQEILADADAALAFALETNDYDLLAELLMTWPMLGARWSQSARFALTVVTEVYDRHGFLPGLAHDPRQGQQLSGQELTDYIQSTSYHASYMMGMLCAVIARSGLPVAMAVRRSRIAHGAGQIYLDLIRLNSHGSWLEAFAHFDERQWDTLAPLLLTMLGRQARRQRDLTLVRTILQTALEAGIADGPTTTQLLALLRRAGRLAQLVTVHDHDLMPTSEPTVHVMGLAALPVTDMQI
jgi:hypothetical protein